MKLNYLLLAFLTITFFSCGDDDDNGFSVIDGSLIHYDGDNETTPFFPAGTYEAAARFDASDMSELSDQQLTQVQLVMGAQPLSCFIKIYDEGTDSAPGNVLLQQEITNEVSTLQFTTHTLNTPIDLGDSDIWISVRFTTTSSSGTVGCDEGPRINDGDWFLTPSDPVWRTLSEVNTASINWNIRGVVE